MSDDAASNQEAQQLEQQLKSLAPAVKKLLLHHADEQPAIDMLVHEGIAQEIAAEFVEYIRDIFKIDFKIGQSIDAAEDQSRKEPRDKPVYKPDGPAAPADSVFERPAHIAQRSAIDSGTEPVSPVPTTPAEPQPEVKRQPQLPLERQQAATPAPPPRYRRSGEEIDEISMLKANVRSILKNPRNREP